MAEPRDTRGPLSTIDMLPEEAAHLVVAATRALDERTLPQTEILAELNEGLAELGLEPVARSTFNRHSIRLATAQKRREETQSIYAAIGKPDLDETDDFTMMLIQMGKELVFRVATDTEDLNVSGALELSRAINALVNAEKEPLKRQRQAEAMKAHVNKVIDTAVAEKGLTDERATDMRNKLLGVK